MASVPGTVGSGGGNAHALLAAAVARREDASGASQFRKFERACEKWESARATAEKVLASKGSTSEEKCKAAALLGELKYESSFKPLLALLGHEKDERVLLSALKALKEITREHSTSRTIGEGRRKLRDFALANLERPELVASALDALLLSGNSRYIGLAVQKVYIEAQNTPSKDVASRAYTCYLMDGLPSVA